MMKASLISTFLQALTVYFLLGGADAASTAKVICGGGTTSKKCYLTPKMADKEERYGARCCSSSSFYHSEHKTKNGCSNYAGTITNILSPGLGITSVPGKYCPWKLTYAEAELYCSNLGATLCTEAEIEGKCAKASGCHLNWEYIWSLDPTTPAPTASPTDAPTASPTVSPTASPTASPTDAPTASPTTSPTASPTAYPTDAPTDSPTGQPTPETCSKPFMMVNPDSGRVVNVANGSCADGANINLWDRNYSNGQIFCYDPTTKALINRHCNKAIDFGAWPNCEVSLHNLVLKTRSGHTTQGYHVGGQGIMGANLQNVVITNKYCTNHVIDIEGGTSKENGTNMIVWPSHGGWNQRWSIEYV